MRQVDRYSVEINKKKYPINYWFPIDLSERSKSYLALISEETNAIGSFPDVLWHSSKTAVIFRAEGQGLHRD